jgi:hypothetical protein
MDDYQYLDISYDNGGIHMIQESQPMLFISEYGIRRKRMGKRWKGQYLKDKMKIYLQLSSGFIGILNVFSVYIDSLPSRMFNI